MSNKEKAYSKDGAELRKIQKELVDAILTKPEDLEKIINIQLAARKGFHQYSFRNTILANWQLYCRTGETAELLAPYSKWANLKVDGKRIRRNVKKGEKALRILAPYTFTVKEEDDEGNEVEKTVLRFKSVPVFDLSQTEGDPLETDFTSFGKFEFTLEEIINRGSVKVNLSQKEITRGYTDGKEIWISQHISTSHQICTYFHELAHYHLHFDSDRFELDTPTKELEAEAVAYLVSCYLGIDNKESPAYIWNWNQDKSDSEKEKLLKGKGSRVLNTAQLIIDQLKLSELLNSKNEATDKVVEEVGVEA